MQEKGPRSKKEHHHSTLESIWKKVIRHVLTGEFDRRTLRSGMQQLRTYLETWKMKRVEPVFKKTIENFEGNKNLTVYRYDLTGNEKSRILEDRVALTEFPSGSIVTVLCFKTKKSYQRWTQGELATLDEGNTVAEFVGPTSRSAFTARQLELMPLELSGDLPNNGFAYNGTIIRPFMDTYPTGQRRGALAITAEGAVRILTEDERLKGRENSFAEFETVAGTSFYFSSDDSTRAAELLHEPNRSEVSYFITFVDSQGRERLGHIHFITQVNRMTVKKTLDTHAKQFGWKSYRAAELDLSHSGCIVPVHNNQSSTSVSTSGHSIYAIRHDHYLVQLEKNIPSSVVDLII